MLRPLGLLACTLLACGCRGRAEVVVYCTDVLCGVLSDVVGPPLRMRLEPGDDGLARRKLLELEQRADLVVVRDATSLQPVRSQKKIGSPTLFATDEIVLAHKDHSAFTDKVSTATFAQVLRQPVVRLGCANPATADVGAHAQQAWGLAGAPDLAARCDAAQLVPGEPELVALLESRAVDYVFLHRSIAESHHLKVTAVPSPKIVCALAIPSGAANPADARRVVEALLSDAGRRALERAGFSPLEPGPARAP